MADHNDVTDSEAPPGGAPRSAAEVRPPRPRAGGRRRRRWSLLGATVLAVLAAVTLVWFQPQKLLYDQRVAEPLPTASAPPQGTRSGTASEAVPVELASGTFVSREHPTRGTARVLRLADGRVVIRLEGFATSNGPVLVVWLSKNPAHGPDDAFGDAYVDLGPLKGNVGDQNYAVPAGVDTTAYTSVVVWCARFHVSFGAADLAAGVGSAAAGPVMGG